ncbi:MAG: FkbM family methyltransferase, partial [Fischerella sp.]|nr:FkbM family methyltransferase [Fischerella sp.]
MTNSYADCYWKYLKRNCPQLDSDTLSRLAAELENTSWEEPKSANDFNNVAVVALIEAEHCSDLFSKRIYIDMALAALNQGVDLHAHPLCAAHLALVLAMTGEMQQALELAFSTFVNTLQAAYTKNEKISPGIVYLPLSRSHLKNSQTTQMLQILQSEDGYTQALLVVSEVLCQTQIVFYNTGGLRILQLASQMFPSSTSVNLKLGISSICNNQWEGLLYLHRANKLQQSCAPVIQALYIAYRDLKQIDTANYWLNVAHELCQQHPEDIEWQWSKLELNSAFTYVTFEDKILLAVEPSFRSIVTSVLIAEGDWFEKEMEFWRSLLKPGMTVIDVGANVGVYTFSAALRVGSEGRVLAVEPFSGCVRCLQETCRVNQLNWVTVCAGAASDRLGTARLSLSNASE